MLKPLITLQSVSLVPQFLLPFWNCRDLKHHRNVVQRSSLQPGQEQPNASPLEAPVVGGLSTKQQKGKMCVEERGHESHWKQRWQGLEPRATGLNGLVLNVVLNHLATEKVNMGWGEKIQVWKEWCLQKERQQRRQEHQGSAFGIAGGQKGGLG